MPVTAKLSKHFYERLGDEIANELVDWFNQVDIAYKSDLREMNELNYARFEAKLDQRLAEFRAEVKGDIAGLRTELTGQIAGLRTELTGEVAGLRTELTGLVAGSRAESKGEIAGLRVDVNSKIDGLATEMQRGFKEQYRVFFLAWTTLFVGLLAAIIPLYFR
jgi:hypothetical protein